MSSPWFSRCFPSLSENILSGKGLPEVLINFKAWNPFCDFIMMLSWKAPSNFHSGSSVCSSGCAAVWDVLVKIRDLCETSSSQMKFTLSSVELLHGREELLLLEELLCWILWSTSCRHELSLACSWILNPHDHALWVLPPQPCRENINV